VTVYSLLVLADYLVTGRLEFTVFDDLDCILYG